MAEKARRFKERERLKLEKEMHLNNKEKKKIELGRNRNLLVNFLRCVKKPDVSKRSENINMKFAAFEPKFGVKYARPQAHTIGPNYQLFAEKSFDFVSTHLLEYRVHEHKNLSSRSEGRRP